MPPLALVTGAFCFDIKTVQVSVRIPLFGYQWSRCRRDRAHHFDTKYFPTITGAGLISSGRLGRLVSFLESTPSASFAVNTLIHQYVNASLRQYGIMLNHKLIGYIYVHLALIDNLMKPRLDGRGSW